MGARPRVGDGGGLTGIAAPLRETTRSSAPSSTSEAGLIADRILVFTRAKRDVGVGFSVVHDRKCCGTSCTTGGERALHLESSTRGHTCVKGYEHDERPVDAGRRRQRPGEALVRDHTRAKRALPS